MKTLLPTLLFLIALSSYGQRPQTGLILNAGITNSGEMIGDEVTFSGGLHQPLTEWGLGVKAIVVSGIDVRYVAQATQDLSKSRDVQVRANLGASYLHGRIGAIGGGTALFKVRPGLDLTLDLEVNRSDSWSARVAFGFQFNIFNN